MQNPQPASTDTQDKKLDEHPAVSTCPNCSAAIEQSAQFCFHCGKALSGQERVEASGAAASPPPDILAKPMREARTALLVVAIIQIIGAAFFLFAQREEPATIVVILLISGFFWGFWLWAKKNPLPATIAGLVTFITVHVADAIVAPEQIVRGIIMKIIVVTFLVKGVKAGLEYRSARAKVTRDTSSAP